jgi:hypothetical protein
LFPLIKQIIFSIPHNEDGPQAIESPSPPPAIQPPAIAVAASSSNGNARKRTSDITESSSSGAAKRERDQLALDSFLQYLKPKVEPASADEDNDGIEILFEKKAPPKDAQGEEENKENEVEEEATQHEFNFDDEDTRLP